MPLDFPSSPTNGETYGNYYYDATVGAWNSFSSTVNTIPSTLKNLTVSTASGGLTPFTVTNSSGTVVSQITSDGVVIANSLILTTPVGVSNGGTGATTFTSGSYLKGNGTDAIQAQIGIPFADVTMQAIPAAANLNTYTTQGLYHQGSDAQASGGTNYPVARAGLLEVFQSGADGSGFTYQRYTVYQAFHAVYTRAKYTTTWSAWQQIPVGTVTVDEGGTGATSFTSGAYLKGAGTSAIIAQTGIPGTDLTSSITIANGGTGVTTGAGLVPVVPTSLTTVSGSASVNSLGAVTMSGVSSVALNGVFTSAYKNYRIQVHIGNTSATGNLFITPRIGSADVSATLYYQSVLAFQGGTTGTSWSNLVNFWHITGFSAAATTPPYAAFSGDIFGPQDANTRTVFNGQGLGITSSAWETRNIAGWDDTVRSCDGIRLWSASSQTFSGTIRIYGYTG